MSSSTTSTTVGRPARVRSLAAGSSSTNANTTLANAANAATALSPTANYAEKRVKVVLVGNAYVGKTSMLFAYIEGSFLGAYQSTVFDNYAVTITVDGRPVTLNLFDTAGQEDYSHLRVLSYPNTDVFLLCFSMVDADSLDACQQVWMPEIRKHVGGDAQVILVGTKEDLLDSTASTASPTQAHVQTPLRRVEVKAAQRAAAEMGCRRFLICSSLTHRGLKRVFDEALLLALQNRRYGWAADSYNGGLGHASSIDSTHSRKAARCGCASCCSVM